MLKALGWAILMVWSSGCVIEEERGRHPRPAVVAPGHVHCYGCGHVYRGGVWVDID